MSSKNIRPGRPKVDSERVDVRLPRDLLDGIDRFASEESDNPGRAEAVRRIIRDWLIGHGYLQHEEEPPAHDPRFGADGTQRQVLTGPRRPVKRS